jgi:hypothetical protein
MFKFRYIWFINLCIIKQHLICQLKKGGRMSAILWKYLCPPHPSYLCPKLFFLFIIFNLILLFLHLLTCVYIFFLLTIFLVALGLELVASCLLGRCSTTRAIPPAIFPSFVLSRQALWKCKDFSRQTSPFTSIHLAHFLVEQKYFNFSRRECTAGWVNMKEHPRKNQYCCLANVRNKY